MAVDGSSAWIHGDYIEPKDRWPRYVWRQDVASVENVERFMFDESAANGAGKRTIDRAKADRWLRFPLAVGKKYTVKRPWDNGQGFDELTANVQAYERVKVDGVEFDSYRIQYAGSWNQRTGENATGRVETLVWYAPEVKGFVSWQNTT